jgi:ATP-dependent Clp protease ATP-binding subunit ClpA
MTNSTHQRTNRATPHAGARELRTILDAVEREAAQRGSATIEAEHLLLALAARPDSEGGAFLLSHGLDVAALEGALETERRHSLDSVGAPAIAATHLAATRRSRRPRWGASARDALDRGMHVGRGHQGASTLNLVVGALVAELGTVPRMLALAGIDRHRLLGRALSGVAQG